MRNPAAQAASAPLEKHRLEALAYSVDWTNRLASGESLTGNPTVTVLLDSDGTFSDVSSEFSITSLSTTENKSTWRLGAASTDEQDADAVYYVRVSQATDNSQTLISIHLLIVYEFADTTAP